MELILDSELPYYQGLQDKILTNGPHPGLQRDPIKFEEEDDYFTSSNLLSYLDGFCLVVGSRGEVVFASDNIQKFVGLTADEVLGQHLADFVHPCDQVTFLHYLDNSFL